MLSYFPNKISKTGIYLYLGSLAVVTLVFHRYAMKLTYILMGIMWVVGFFMLVSDRSRRWGDVPRRHFLWTLFYTALILRWLWVIFSYFFYTYHTGIPFEFAAADSIGYYEDGYWLSTQPFDKIIDYLFTSRSTVSDSGYFLYLAIICKVFGSSIILVRLFGSVLSSASLALVYYLGRRNIGEDGGRLAATMACFMPNLIVYCGLHLKENVMLVLILAFLERADYLIRSRNYNVFTIALPVLIAIVLFSFRTVLGVVAIFSLLTAIVLTSSETMGANKRWVLITWALVGALTLWGGTIRAEVESTWDDRADNQTAKRASQTAHGNQWAKYATGTVMAPFMFVMPFPTMVDVDEQYNQQILSGGNFVRNFLGGFVLIAVFSAIFITKNWRDLSLVGSFVFAYLLILSFSGFANSERFLLPALPGLLIMASYGVTLLDARSYHWLKYWYYVVPLLSVGWAFFKLGSRAIL